MKFDIKAKLQELLSVPTENETVEFKEAKGRGSWAIF